MKFIRWAAAVDLVLVIAAGAVPGLQKWMPFAGSPVAQLGMCLGLAYAYTEFAARKRGEDDRDGPSSQEGE